MLLCGVAEGVLRLIVAHQLGSPGVMKLRIAGLRGFIDSGSMERWMRDAVVKGNVSNDNAHPLVETGMQSRALCHYLLVCGCCGNPLYRAGWFSDNVAGVGEVVVVVVCVRPPCRTQSCIDVGVFVYLSVRVCVRVCVCARAYLNLPRSTIHSAHVTRLPYTRTPMYCAYRNVRG